jgi:hypothetical protein
MPTADEICTRQPMGIVFLATTFIAVLWAAVIFDTSRMKHEAIDRAESDARNLAAIFQESIKGTMSGIDQLMIAIIAANNQSEQRYQIPRWIENSPLLKGTLVQMSITGPDGIVVASNLDIAERIDLSDRLHFRYHLDPSAS